MCPFSDLALARRLETTEALACARSVEARARVDPSSGACWIEVAGAHAMFDGAASPVTQTFGLGMAGPATAHDFETIERFFTDRGAPILHEVSPLADPSVVALLTERGYQPFEFTSVMYRPLDGGGTVAAVDSSVHVRTVGADEGEQWARVSRDGWNEFPGLGDFMLQMGRVGAATEGARLYLAEIDGRPIAAASLRIHEGVAFLAGASTVPDGRRRGAQLALLDRRLRDGAAAGCDIAMMGALPGSGSQRNAERHGFRIAYTRVKWRLP